MHNHLFSVALLFFSLVIIFMVFVGVDCLKIKKKKKKVNINYFTISFATIIKW